MPNRWITVHDCEATNVRCKCRRKTTRKDAEHLVGSGWAVWKLRWVGNDRFVEDHSELIIKTVLVHDCGTTPDGDRRTAETLERPISQKKAERVVACRQEVRRIYRSADGSRLTCDCKRRITLQDAEDLVARGWAVWKWRRGHPPIKDHRQLIQLRVAYPTKAHMLNHRDIEIYGFQKQEHERIAAFAPRRS